MQRASIRHYVLIGLVILAAASMFPSLGGGSKAKPTPVPTQRTRYEAPAGGHHPRAAAAGLMRPADRWAER